MEIRAARPQERGEVLDLLALWYNDRDFFARYNLHDPKFRDDLCLVARADGKIVATVQIFDRTVSLSGYRVPMGGIGSVYTLEDYRNRGIASALMRLAIETMKREGFEVSSLFTDRLKFYEKFGWHPVTRRFTVLTGMKACPLYNLAIELFDPGSDLSSVIEIHREYSGRFESTMIRDEADWRGNLLFAGNPGEHFVIAREAGVGESANPIQAYARAIRFYGIPTVMEYGYRNGRVDAVIALFSHLWAAVSDDAYGNRNAVTKDAASILRDHNSTSSTVLITHTAHDLLLEQNLANAGFTLMHHEDNFYMWRIISPSKFARRLGLPSDAAERKLLELVGGPNSLFWTADRF